MIGRWPSQLSSAGRRRAALALTAVQLVAVAATAGGGSAPAPARSAGGSEALSCGVPCTTGSLTASHPFYDVTLACDDGAFTATTGTFHALTIAAGAPQSVFYTLGTPATSEIGLRVHNNISEFINPVGASVCAFDPPDTLSEPSSLGLEAEWTIDPLIAGLQPLILREEIVAFGTTDADSGIRYTLGVTNPAGSAEWASIGVRWLFDYYQAADDGPGFAPVICSPFTIAAERFTEHELLGGEVKDYYRTQNNLNTPVYSTFISSTAINGFAGTGRPDRLIHGYWPQLQPSVWDYVPTEGADCDRDAAALHYYGYAPGSGGIAVAPGQTVTRSVISYTTAAATGCHFLPATTSCLVGGLSPIRLLQGVKDGAGGARFSWQPDPASTVVEYHLNTVRAKVSLREPDVHPPLATNECVPTPPTATSCTDPDAIADGTALFYQVFSACGGTGSDEGPI